MEFSLPVRNLPFQFALLVFQIASKLLGKCPTDGLAGYACRSKGFQSYFIFVHIPCELLHDVARREKVEMHIISLEL